MTLKTRVKFSGHLLWWLLSHADNVEFLEPRELRELIAETRKHAAAQYDGRSGSTGGSISPTE